MADTAFQTQFRQEFIHGFEQKRSIVRDSVTTEAMVKGNQATFLVADSGGADAVTRGTNGRIPGRSDNLTQPTAVLKEWHDKVERTGFNLFASQGDGRRIMQATSMAVINRKIDQDIIDQLNTATNDTGSAGTATLTMVGKSKTILGNNEVPFDGMIYGLITPAFYHYLTISVPQFASADYVTRKPIDGQSGAEWGDEQGYYEWYGVKWIVHPKLPGVGTNAEKCFLYHKSSVGHAAPSDLIQTSAGYNDEHDYSFARCTAYMGGKLLQNSGVVVMNHDGSAFVAS